MVEHGFLKDINRKMLLLSDDIENLLSQMNNYKASECSKWITKENV